MSGCPACGREVRPIWPTCRSCGALLMAPPAPVAPVGAPVTTAGPSAEEQFFAPAVLQPVARRPFADRPAYTTAGSTPSAGTGTGTGKWLALVAVVGLLVAAVVSARLTFAGAGARHATPVALAPVAPTAGLPTNLGAVVRIQAESARRTALQAVEQAGNGDRAALAAMQPSFAWLAGDKPSTDPHEVSVEQDGGVVTVAVAASNHDVCAFGQWWNGSAPQYVTMAHEPSCAAADAPSAGWTRQAGGAASDLPDDNG